MQINPIRDIAIDAKSLIRSEKNRQARERAIADLINNNDFHCQGHSGPFNLYIEVVDNRFVMDVINDDKKVEKVSIPLTPLKKVIRDYHIICESYYDAVSAADSKKIEAIDMGRRGVHNEGSEILQDLISEKIKADFETVRKLFSLIYVLQIK